MSEFGLQTKVDELNFTTRVLNTFANGGITYLRELLSYSAAELLRLEGFGKVSLAEVRQELKLHGLELRDEPSRREMEQQLKVARLEWRIGRLQNMLEFYEKEAMRLKGYVQTGAVELKQAQSAWITAERNLEYRVQQLEQRLGLRGVLGAAS